MILNWNVAQTYPKFASKEKVLLQYKNRKISLQKAAELLKIDFTEMLEIIKKEGLYLNYTEEELNEDLRGLK